MFILTNDMRLLEIREILKNSANEKTKLSIKKFIPSSKKVYGVRTSLLNGIAKKIREPDFGLIEKLWQSGAFEERLLAIKILMRISKDNPEKFLKLIKKFSKDISDWAVCDTLATQGIRKIAKIKQKGIFEISERFISSKNFWRRRFAIVLLVELNRQGFANKKNIKVILKKAEKDKEYYVKKAVIWLKRELK
jgi:3-methyladenine DNA glycosylase AlkD